MRERGEYALALVLDLLGAGAALLVATRHWQTLRVPRERPFHDVVVQLSGRTLDGAPTAFAVVALAGVVAILATRGVVRRVVGAVVALAGAGLIWRSLGALAAVSPSRAAVLARDKHPGGQFGSVLPQVGAHPVWAVLSAGCGLLVVGAGAAVAWRGHRWSAMSAKYDRAQQPIESAEDAERARQRESASLWSALDRGDDPTGGEDT